MLKGLASMLARRGHGGHPRDKTEVSRWTRRCERRGVELQRVSNRPLLSAMFESNETCKLKTQKLTLLVVLSVSLQLQSKTSQKKPQAKVLQSVPILAMKRKATLSKVSRISDTHTSVVF